MEVGIKNFSDDVKEVGDDIKVDLTNLNKLFFSTILKVNAMNNMMEKFMNKKPQDQKKIDNIFQVHRLRLSDYEKTDEKQRGRVTKRVNLREIKAKGSHSKSLRKRTKIL